MFQRFKDVEGLIDALWDQAAPFAEILNEILTPTLYPSRTSKAPADVQDALQELGELTDTATLAEVLGVCSLSLRFQGVTTEGVFERSHFRVMDPIETIQPFLSRARLHVPLGPLLREELQVREEEGNRFALWAFDTWVKDLPKEAQFGVFLTYDLAKAVLRLRRRYETLLHLHPRVTFQSSGKVVNVSEDATYLLERMNTPSFMMQTDDDGNIVSIQVNREILALVDGVRNEDWWRLLLAYELWRHRLKDAIYPLVERRCPLKGIPIFFGDGTPTNCGPHCPIRGGLSARSAGEADVCPESVSVKQAGWRKADQEADAHHPLRAALVPAVPSTSLAARSIPPAVSVGE